MYLHDKGVFYINGKLVEDTPLDKEEGRKKTIAYKIMDAHDNHADKDILHLKFDSMASHDITYVGIIQTARAKIISRHISTSRRQR